jgi:hypothetical protein
MLQMAWRRISAGRNNDIRPGFRRLVFPISELLLHSPIRLLAVMDNSDSVDIWPMTVRSVVRFTLSLTFLSVSGITQERLRPTTEDLKTLVADWKQLTASGQILNMNSKVVLISDQNDLQKVEEAKKIGDDKDTTAELIKNEKASRIEAETQVRLLDTFRAICFAFRTLHLACSDVPTTLQGLYQELSSTKVVRAGNLSEADVQARQKKQLDMSTRHDLSAFVADTYALVRVVSGPQSGTKGWVRMTELRQIPTISKP